MFFSFPLQFVVFLVDVFFPFAICRSSFSAIFTDTESLTLSFLHSLSFSAESFLRFGWFSLLLFVVFFFIFCLYFVLLCLYDRGDTSRGSNLPQNRIFCKCMCCVPCLQNRFIIYNTLDLSRPILLFGEFCSNVSCTGLPNFCCSSTIPFFRLVCLCLLSFSSPLAASSFSYIFFIFALTIS